MIYVWHARQMWTTLKLCLYLREKRWMPQMFLNQLYILRTNLFIRVLLIHLSPWADLKIVNSSFKIVLQLWSLKEVSLDYRWCLMKDMLSCIMGIVVSSMFGGLNHTKHRISQAWIWPFLFQSASCVFLNFSRRAILNHRSTTLT